MQIELTAEGVSALMSKMPSAAIGPQSGFVYDDGVLNIPAEWDAAATAVMAVVGWDTAPVPTFSPITRRQLRLTLLAHSLLDQVEPAIATLDEPERSVALIEWQDASEYRRDHALIAQIGAALDLDAAAIDAMWVEAMGR